MEQVKNMKSNIRNTVVLVDQYDNDIGVMDKLEAHQSGSLHRAFSIFLFNTSGQILLQQRAFEKYHGGGLWTNACCSHPQLGEDILASAQDRLLYEMGLVCDLQRIFTFTYQAKVENGLIEHELDHVFVGHVNDMPIPHPEEVEDYRWWDIKELQQDISLRNKEYTTWFKMSLPRVLHLVQQNQFYLEK